jgi:hypothetical protein
METEKLLPQKNMEKRENIDLIVKCPHCNDYILIEKLNCKIFRHGTLKESGIQINPHASKEECDNYAKNNLIYGCGKPFRIIENSTQEKYKVVDCEYI